VKRAGTLGRRAGVGSAPGYLLATFTSLVVTAVVQSALGRSLICACGYVKLWHGDIWSSENSQHLTDWYTFTHVIHGFAFYYLLRLFRHLTFFQAFVLALILETSWEIVENTSFIIDRYRESTISLEYFGDSIVNSLSDILAMALGFYLAGRLPARMIVLLTVALELGIGYLIRDNLALNIVMLICDCPAIKQWQMGG